MGEADPQARGNVCAAVVESRRNENHALDSSHPKTKYLINLYSATDGATHGL
jgi:hypothetical protein